MYVYYNEKKYWLNRAFWFGSGMCTVYEFVTNDGDVYTVDIGIDECLENKVELYIEEE